jgi:hypothetical protein
MRPDAKAMAGGSGAATKADVPRPAYAVVDPLAIVGMATMELHSAARGNAILAFPGEARAALPAIAASGLATKEAA